MQTIQLSRQLSGKIHIRRRPTAARELIDLTDSAQVGQWCRALGITWLELFNAVDKVGTDASDVLKAVRIP